MKQLVTIFFLVLFYYTSEGQVDSVKHLIKYNPQTCLFDCFTIIASGSAYSPQERIQGSSQYSIIVPTGSTVTVAQNFAPFQNNQNNNSNLPGEWRISSIVQSPTITPEYDYIGINAPLSPACFYKNLNQGDTVKLFSLSITPIINCASQVRIFDNDNDPLSHEPGMQGGDFRNGFSMDDPDANLFHSGLNTVSAPIPSIIDLNTTCSQGIEISLEATTHTCQLPLTYSWSGPDGYNSQSNEVILPNAEQHNSGLYKVTITDAIGCAAVAETFANAKPSVEGDTYISCNLTNTATLMASPVSGIWTIGDNSSGTAYISNPNANSTTAQGFSEPGMYSFLWTASGCSDTIFINVNNNCDCNITNNLILPPTNEFCGSLENFTLNGNNVPNATGDYLWIISTNNQNFLSAPGNNTQQNYTISSLGIGTYKFKRIFNKTSEGVCADTSNIIELKILGEPSAGNDQNIMCFTDDQVSVIGSSEGVWSIGSNSSGTAVLSTLSNANTTVSNFSQSGLYYLIRSNSVCSDTMMINAGDICGCSEAFGGDDKIKCSGDSLVLTGSCQTGTWNALSSNPVGATIFDMGNGTIKVQFLESALGDFKFVFSIGETMHDTVNVQILTPPVVLLGNDFAMCEGSDPVVLAASGGQSYLWSTGANTSSIIVNPSTTSTYTVIGTNSVGCSASDQIVVTIHPKPVGSVPDTIYATVGDILYINSGVWQHAALYSWIGPNNFHSAQQNNFIDPASITNTGIYYLTVTSEFNCESYANTTVIIQQQQLPILLNRFDAFYDTNKKVNRVRWHVESEVNCYQYTIVRTEVENKNTKIIDNISCGVNIYEIIDNDISFNTLYNYSLIQQDYDGKSSVYGPIHVQTPKNIISDISVYPNPTSKEINVVLNTEINEHLTIKLYDVRGVLISEKHINPGHYNEIRFIEDADILETGLYFIQLISKEVEFQSRILIQR